MTMMAATAIATSSPKPNQLQYQVNYITGNTLCNNSAAAFYYYCCLCYINNRLLRIHKSIHISFTAILYYAVQHHFYRRRGPPLLIYDVFDEFCSLEPLDPPPTGLLLCLSVSLFFPICAHIVSQVFQRCGGPLMVDPSSRISPPYHYRERARRGSASLMFIFFYGCMESGCFLYQISRSVLQ